MSIIAYCSPKRNQNLSRNYTMSDSVTLAYAYLVSRNTSTPNLVTADVFCDYSSIRAENDSSHGTIANILAISFVFRLYLSSKHR